MLLAPHNEPPNEATKRRYGGHNSDSKLYEADEAPAGRATSASTPVQEVVMRRRITSSSEDGMPPKTDEADTAAAISVGKAFFDYQAKQEDELSFKRGSIVEILDKNPGERGWVYGQINGVKGMIPENYVHLVGKQPTVIKSTEFECSWLSNDEVGGGASSRVYRGRWNNHEVALKKIKPTSKDKDQAIIEALKREALIYARLNHKNIVQFYGICYDEPPCLLLELCKGKTLFSLYRQLTYSVPSFVVSWALQIARAMSCMHELDEALIHADLKADNVLIKEEPCLCDQDEKTPRALNEKNYDREGKCLRCKKTALNRLTLKLTDFGLSRPEKATQGGFAGSVPWMSPELVRDGFHSKEADVWAFGVVIWELVTNQIPHQEFEGHLLHAAIGGQNVTPKIPDDCPKYLEDIMRACWQIEPKDRPTFTQLTKMLANVQNNPVDNVKRPNNRDSLKRIQHRREDIRELEEMIQRNAIDTSQYASYQPARLFPPASGPNTRRPKITKDTIGSPTGFKHMVAILKRSPKDVTTRPVGISNSDGGKPPTVPDDTQNLTLPRNYKHSTFFVEPTLNKSSSTLIDSCNGSHEDVGDSEESSSSSHLRPLWFGRPPKAFKSNPELSGLSVNRSRLERSNARRKRNVEVVHPSKTEPALLDDCVIDLTVDFHTGSPHLRNRSESNDTAFESPSPRGSGRKKKNSSSSTFYVDDDGSSISQESTQTSGSKKKGVFTWFKNKKEKGRDSQVPAFDHQLGECGGIGIAM
ncbi:SH3 domain protein [Aphelenchoides fujianensis]|nr:SH3 domain protein [Aphelenchoides fujianensis]